MVEEKSFKTVVSNLSDEELISLLQSTRPWATHIKYFSDRGELTATRRKSVRILLCRIWYLDMLNHREIISTALASMDKDCQLTGR